MGPVVGDVVFFEQQPRDPGVLLDEFGTEDPAHAHGLELVVERARTPAGDDAVTEHVAHRGQRERRHDRVAVRDERRGAQDQTLGDAADRAEHGERLEEVAIGCLEFAVGLEQQVVTHPDGVEPELLGQL